MLDLPEILNLETLDRTLGWHYNIDLSRSHIAHKIKHERWM